MLEVAGERVQVRAAASGGSGPRSSSSSSDQPAQQGPHPAPVWRGNSLVFQACLGQTGPSVA